MENSSGVLASTSLVNSRPPNSPSEIPPGVVWLSQEYPGEAPRAGTGYTVAGLHDREGWTKPLLAVNSGVFTVRVDSESALFLHPAWQQHQETMLPNAVVTNSHTEHSTTAAVSVSQPT